jgi:hypothetical protein
MGQSMQPFSFEGDGERFQMPQCQSSRVLAAGTKVEFHIRVLIEGELGRLIFQMTTDQAVDLVGQIGRAAAHTLRR